MDKHQTCQKINMLRHNIEEIYNDCAPFIRHIAIKLENEINQIIIGYINKHFANKCKNMTENDINDLISLFCNKDELKLGNRFPHDPFL